MKMTKFRKYDDFINGKYAINAINSNQSSNNISLQLATNRKIANNLKLL